MRRAFLLLIAFLLLSAGGLSANTLLVTASGTFSSTTPTSTFSAPGESWSFSFEVDSMPVVLSSEYDLEFSPSFTDFTYTLDGSAVAITPANIQFYSADDGGLLNVCFAPACPSSSNPTNGFELEGAQAYSGLVTSPTINTGVYPTITLLAFVGGEMNFYTMDNSIVTIASVPEPGTLSFVIVLGMGILACTAMRRRCRG